MAIVMTHLKVKDYTAWRPSFDGGKELRDAAGLKDVRVLRSVDEPNEVFIQGETNDVAKARQFASSPELKSAMEKAGVIGPATFYILNPT